MILHIDMDAFFASVEQQINPTLRGKPVIVGARDSKHHTVVTAASYEAKAYGISSGMPSWKALKICPHAEFVACDSVRYTYVSGQIFELLKDYAPQVEHATIDEFDLEISGLEPFFGPPLELGKIIKKRIREAFGLACSVGIAPTWILAKLGTKIKKPDGLILIDDSNLDSLIKDLPVEKICGIGPALTAHLQSLGIMTCGQLKTTTQAILIDHFGKTTGHWLFHILRTEKNQTWQKGEIEPREIPKSIGHSYTLPAETRNKNTIHSWLRILSEMIGERMRKNGLLGHTISLWTSSRNESFLRQKTYQTPTSDGWEIFARARALLGQEKAKITSIRALGVTLSGLEKNQTPPLLIEQKRREALLASMDKINERFGDWAIHPASIKDIG